LTFIDNKILEELDLSFKFNFRGQNLLKFSTLLFLPIALFSVQVFDVDGDLIINVNTPDEVVVNTATTFNVIVNNGFSQKVQVSINSQIDSQNPLSLAMESVGGGTPIASTPLTTTPVSYITGIADLTEAHHNILTYTFDSSNVVAGTYSQVITFTMLDE